MKYFSKNLIIFSLPLLIFSLFFLKINIVLGQDTKLINIPEISLDPFQILWNAVNWFFNFVIIFGIIFIIYAGYTYVTSGGDTGKTKKAMQILMYALIGIAIALLAKALINFVSEWIGAGKILEGGTTQQQQTKQQGGSTRTSRPAEIYFPFYVPLEYK